MRDGEISMTVCLDRAKQFAQDLFGLDKPMSDKQLDQFIQRLRKRAKFIRVTNNTLTEGEALQEAGNQLVEGAKLEAQLLKKRAYLNVIKKTERRANLETLGFKPSALRAITGGTNTFRFSADNMQGAAFKLLFGGKEGFWTKLRDEDLVPIFHDPTKETDIANSIINRDDLVVDKDAGRVGKIAQGAIELSRKMQNKWGANIRKLDTFIASTAHDPMKMLRLASTLRGHLQKLAEMRLGGATKDDILDAAFERWKNFIWNRLDHDLTFIDTDGSKAEKEKFLRGAYFGLISKIHKQFRDDPEITTPSFTRGASFARLIGQKERILHFKNEAAPWLEYNRAYGSGTLSQALTKLFERSAKNYGLMKFWGPDVFRNYRDLRQEVQKRNQLGSTNFKLTRVDNIMKELDGTTSSPVSYRFARISANVRSFISMARLGLVVPSSLSDIAAKAATLRFQGIGFLDAQASAFADLKNIFGEEEDLKKVHDLIGSSAENMLGAMNRFAVKDSPGGLMTEINQIFFKLNLLKSWDHLHREGGTTTIARWLAQNKGVPWNRLNPRLRNGLDQYTITAPEWEVLRRNPFKAESGKEFITPDSGETITKQDAANILGKDISQVKSGDLQKASEDLQDKMMMYFHDQANHMILLPTAADRAALIMGQPAGTIPGEALRFIAQFKTYSLAFTRRILGRELMGAMNGKGSYAALGELIVGTAILNYMSLVTKSVLSNETPPDPRQMTTIQRVNFMRRVFTPGVFLLGDWVGGQYNKYGNSFIDQIAGPAFSNAGDLANIGSELIQGKNVTKQSIEWAKGNTPFHNMWFANAGMEYLILHGVMNRIDPSAAANAQQRLLENGQHAIFQ